MNNPEVSGANSPDGNRGSRDIVTDLVHGVQKFVAREDVPFVEKAGYVTFAATIGVLALGLRAVDTVRSHILPNTDQ